MRLRLVVLIAVLASLSLAGVALAAVRLDKFIARNGEETGFTHQGAPHTYATVHAYVAAFNRPQRKAAAARLRREGFVRALYQYMTYVQSPDNGGGLSFVVELGSRKAARAEQRVQLRQDIAAQGNATVHDFKVPGVPGVTAFTATLSPHPGGAANALWTEGRCLLLVGDSIPASNLAGPVKAGVEAIYRRTGGHCP